MRSLLLGLPLAWLLAKSAFAQQPCDAASLPHAAGEVARIENLLSKAAVPEEDPRVPAPVARQLTQLKGALQDAARAAFACAPGDAEPETLGKTLGEALHAHTSPAESTIETHGGKDIGTYGAELSVQVFPLFGSPRYYEVDFRYGLECGDDNLLLVFATDTATATPNDAASWHQVLRWDAPRYETVGDAFGDFVLMTPLSGFPGQRNWRFVVAHGHPGCGASDGLSAFDLDVLEPTSNPAQPTVVWHMQHPYHRNQEPRLSTTEDTLTFGLTTPAGTSARGARTAKAPAHTDTYRYHVTKSNRVEALPTVDAEAPASSTPATKTHSPQ